jgi:hypothetical protein
MDDTTYASLFALNPSGHIRQWRYEGFEDGVTKETLEFFDKLTGDRDDYRYDSLIARVKFGKGVVVYLTLSKDDRQLYEEQGFHGYHSSDLHLVTRQLWEVTTIECHGDKCRRYVSYAENGIWCVSCHGDPDLYTIFHGLLPSTVSFRDIPREAILWARTSGLPALGRHLRHEEMKRLRRDLKPGGFFEQQQLALDAATKKARERLEELEKVVVFDVNS